MTVGIVDVYPEVSPMAEDSRVQFEFRSSKPLTKIVASAAIILAILALVALHWSQKNIQSQTDELRSQAADLEYENNELQDKIDGLGSVDSAKNIAEEELGLVDPDTVIIDPD